jgi:hypothetical protein
MRDYNDCEFCEQCGDCMSCGMCECSTREWADGWETYGDVHVMQNLVGRKVSALSISDNQSLLVVTHDEGEAIYETEGDCCSNTWIADIVGVDRLLGQMVLAVESVRMESVEDGRTRQDYDRFYGIKLTTTGGYVDIVYRNSSNGYYGGSLERRKDVVTRKLTAITEDFSA